MINTNPLISVLGLMASARRDRLLTHVRCINADKPGLREGYCYKVLRRMRSGDVIIINSNGDERAYGPKRFERVTEARAVVINELWLEKNGGYNG